MNILITGGASGLGKAITLKFAQENLGRVYFTYNQSEKNAQEISAEFSNATGIRCNFKNEADIQSLLEKIHTLDLDVLVNNAYNFQSFAYFQKTSSENFINSFKDNIVPTIEITKMCISNYRKKKQGRIITVLTSYLLDVPPIGSSIYVANKAYLEKLTKVWANENAKYNITSNSVSPSFMQTALTGDTDERIIEQITNEHPLKRLLTVEEVADTVFFLSQASPHINGVDIVMNAAKNMT
jgi:NAD(P)-dependent dehydrogenase (short-subunit alcohol dehydrogenase family)